MRSAAFGTFCSTEGCRGGPRARVRGEAGQATVEAAAILPVLMLVFAIILQPVCLCYTRAVMRAAAAEAARAATTAYGGDTAECEACVRRRLGAVPEVPLFHVGGSRDWEVTIARTDHQVDVTIAGHARPLPIMGAIAGAAFERDGSGIVLRVSLSMRGRPSWLGGDYSDWQSVWG